MISAGSCITQSGNVLKKVSIRYLYDSIKNPKPEIVSKIKQLRLIRELNPKEYSVIKKQLPFIVCANFNPPYRKILNFAFTNYFIIDIDHIASKGLNITDVRNKIIADERVLMCFLSPGEDGLKVVFQFSEKCYDAGVYSIFYKIFANEFSRNYGLSQVIDISTSDVSRACFISMDKDIYYNQNAVKVLIESYLDIDNHDQLLQIDKDIKEIDRECKDKVIEKESVKEDLDSEIILKIKNILNPNLKNKIEKPPVYVPEILNDVITDIVNYIQETGLIVSEIINISYGKKIRIKSRLKEAEINLFYGKKGFSIVQSPRTGTNKELNQMAHELIESYLYSNF